MAIPGTGRAGVSGGAKRKKKSFIKSGKSRTSSYANVRSLTRGVNQRAAAKKSKKAQASGGATSSSASANFSRASGGTAYIPPSQAGNAGAAHASFPNPQQPNASFEQPNASFGAPALNYSGTSQDFSSQTNVSSAPPPSGGTDIGFGATSNLGNLSSAQKLDLMTMGVAGRVKAGAAGVKLSSQAVKGLGLEKLLAQYSKETPYLVAKIKNALGTVPSNVAPKTTRDMIAKNTANVRKFKEWIVKKLTESTDVVTTIKDGVATQSIVTRSGKKVGVEKVVKLTFAVLGSWGFAKFIGVEETAQTGGITSMIAHNADRPDLVNETLDILDDVILEKGFIGKIVEWIPGLNIGVAVIQNFLPVAKQQVKVYRAISEDRQYSTETGASDDEVWRLRRLKQQGEEQQTRELNLLYQEQVAEMEAEANDARLAAQQAFNDAERLADAQANKDRLKMNALAAKKQAELEAAYWRDQQENALLFEQEKLRLQKEYWDEYYRRSAEERAAASPSKLKFGFL